MYANAAPDLFDGLNNAVTTARTLNEQQGNIDQALMASVGFGNTGGDDLRDAAARTWSAAPQDLVPTSQLLDEYSPALFCTIRNFHDVEPKIAAVARRQRLLAEHPLRDPRRRQPVRLSGQPAAGERPRRSRGQAGLLAADHP